MSEDGGRPERLRWRAHLLSGLIAALSNRRAVADAVAEAEDAPGARAALMALDLPLPEDAQEAIGQDGPYRLDESQARGVLDLRFTRLVRGERVRLLADLLDVRQELAGGPRSPTF